MSKDQLQRACWEKVKISGKAYHDYPISSEIAEQISCLCKQNHQVNFIHSAKIGFNFFKK